MKDTMTTKIKHTTIRHSGWLFWQLKYEDGSNIHLFVSSENGTGLLAV